MVLEALFSADRLLEKKPLAFLLGLMYSFFSIGLSVYLFPDSFIIFSIALISLLLFPMMSKLLEKEKDIEKKTERLDLRDFIKNHRDVLEVYIFVFLGITLAFMLFSALVPRVVMSHMLENQADLAFSLYADPKEIDFGDFYLILGNNMKVIIVCYLAACFFGAGAILIIAWNASVWGTIFGTILKNASILPGWNPLAYFIFLSIAILPYMMIEASAYFMAGISGGIVSKGLESEGLLSRRFEILIKKSLFMVWMSFLLVLVAAIVESQLTPVLIRAIFG